MRWAALIVLACVAAGCDKPKASGSSAPPATAPTRAIAPKPVTAADLLPSLQAFAGRLPAAILSARTEDHAEVKHQKWKIDVVRTDIENSASALTPLEGVVVVREMMEEPNLLFSDEFDLRLAPEHNNWRLVRASFTDRSGLLGGEETAPRAPIDATDSPLLHRATQIANGQ